MRDTFDNLGQLMGCYHRIKCVLEGQKTILPAKDFNPKSQMNAWAMRSSREEKLCFVGDVEKFVKHFWEKHQRGYTIIPIDCLYLIFLQKFAPAASRFKSYGQLAVHFRSVIRKESSTPNKGRIPRRLQHSEHLSDLGKKMWEPAEQYFTGNGYIAAPKPDDTVL